MNLRRLIVATVSLSMGLAGMQGGALAQIKDAPIITGNVDGSCVTRPSVDSTGANAGDWTITCGDLNPGAGLTVISAPAGESEPAPVVAPEPAPEPVSEPAPVAEPVPVAEPAPETMETAPVETAVATESDLDADNYTDALESDLGLDPTSADTDADGVADGDEIILYSTEPTLFDTDGDGVSDGEELFGIGTDPVVWNDFSTDASTESLAQEAAPAPSAAPQQEVVTQGQETTENLSATNGDAASLGTGNASSAPGTVTRDGVTVPSTSVLGPDGTYKVTENSPPTVNVSGTTSTPPVIVPAPGNDLAPEAVLETVAAEPVAADTAVTAEPVATDSAVATESDLDADNYLDAEELAVGLDPNDPDTDDDGVADGDEAAIYGTDAFTSDSDGDGLADGGELFDTRTDPLVWDTNGNGVSDGEELPA